MDGSKGEDNNACTTSQPCKNIQTAVDVLHMSPYTDRGTIHLYGNHTLDKSIRIEKKLKIQGYNEASISSLVESEPVFWLETDLSLISLHFVDINLIGLSPSKEN